MDVSSEVLQVASRYLHKVRKSGPDNIMAVCPFHRKPDGTDEKTPSFAMSLSKGLFFCHSCQLSGSLRYFFKLLGMPRDQIEYHYSVLLEAVASNTPPRPDPTKPKVFELTPIDEGVLGAFDYCPTSLLDAGFTQTTLRYFDVGYDKWHRRITYPLRDITGRLVAVSGRALPNEATWPRFKIYDKEYTTWGLPAQNAPDKSAILYNADKVYSRVYLAKPNEVYVVVVEGFKACMAVHQAGIRNVVALLGNYVSEDHRWILERMGAPIYMFLDNNFAGRNGTYKGGRRLAQSLPVNVIPYPARLLGEDKAQPDSCLSSEILEGIERAPAYSAWCTG
jgi:DNA primase